MRFVLSSLWVAGGRATGWLDLPPLIELLPWYALAAGALILETSLTHLWFLYYLFWISVVFLLLRWVTLCGPAAPASVTRFSQGAGLCRRGTSRTRLRSASRCR